MHGKDIFTVLEKIGRRTFWRDEEIGAILGSLTGDRRVHVQPPSTDKGFNGPHWLIIDGREEEGRLAARIGHHSFTCDFRRADRLPFKVELK